MTASVADVKWKIVVSEEEGGITAEGKDGVRHLVRRINGRSDTLVSATLHANSSEACPICLVCSFDPLGHPEEAKLMGCVHFL